MSCQFCGSTHNVLILLLKNGYNHDKRCQVNCCENCREQLGGIAIMLSLYATMEL